MIDLSTVRARAREIDTVIDEGVPLGGFLSVSDALSAADAIEIGDAIPPALYISVASEAPDPNRLSSGGRAQRVNVTVSALFCLGADRADDERADAVERARGSLIANLVGFKPDGAVKAFDYAGYALRRIEAGLVWGEVLVSSSWDLRSDA